jgi:threonylcarbamoyladenosine tRNA methylthiotransferase MtaB
MRKRAALHTLGCRLNQSETNLLTEKLSEAGYDVVPFGEEADLGIVHTCTVTREADAKSRKMVRQFIRKNPEAYTAVIGCYAQMGAQTLAQIPGVDLVVGNQEKLNVLDYVAAGKNPEPLIVRDRMVRDDFTVTFPHTETPLTQRTNLKIQDGCDFMCSFCIIPFARGRARSRAFNNLLDEACHLVDRGAKELVLTGVNIGTYGWEEKNILDIVDALNAIPDLARVRISSIEPTTIPEELFARMADPVHNLVPYLHIPLQAGSNTTLEAMRRKYTRDEFLDFIYAAHEAVPDIGIGTDILVGFPGETDAQFEETCDILWESPLFYAHVFKYSEREGTASVRIQDKVSPDVAGARSARLRQLSADKTRMFYDHHVGRTLPVLFEQQRNGRWEGYTESYMRVSAIMPGDLTNRIAYVRLTEVQGDMLLGEPPVSSPVAYA